MTRLMLWNHVKFGTFVGSVMGVILFLRSESVVKALVIFVLSIVVILSVGFVEQTIQHRNDVD